MSEFSNNFFTFLKRHRIIIEASLIGLVALLLRLINLEGYPEWYCDEGVYGQVGWNRWHGIWGHLAWAPNFGPYLLSLITGFTGTVFGKSFFSIRLPIAIVGSLSCVLLYLLGGKLYNRFIGIISALFLAVASLEINRMAMPDNLVAFFLLLTIFSYVLGREGKGNYWTYVAGISSGLAFLAKYTGAAAVVFLVFQSLMNRRHSQLKLSLLLFSFLASTLPLIGLALDWDAFLFDTVGLATRPPDLDYQFRIFLAGSLNNPTGVGGFYFTIWSTLGFILLFYLLARDETGDRLVGAWAAAIVLSYIFYGTGFWAFIVPLYPIYSLAIAIALHDIMQRRKNFEFLTILVLLVMLPMFSQGHLYPNNLTRFGRTIFYAAFALSLISMLDRCFPLIRKHGKDVLGGVAFCLLVAVILSGTLYQSKLVFASSKVKDEQNIADWLNTHAENGDLVGAPSVIVYLLKKPVGIDYADVILYNIKESFLSFSVERLSRYKMDLSLSRLRYFVSDPAIYDVEPGKKFDLLLMDQEWMPVYTRGKYVVYLNPSEAARLFKLERFLQISSADSTTYWVVEDGWGSFSIDKQDKVEGNGSLVAFLTSSEKGRASFRYNPAGFWELPADGLLCFSIKYNDAGWREYYVGLRDDSNHFRFWLFSYTSPDRWQRLKLPINRFYHEDQDFDISKVNYIIVGVYDPTRPETNITVQIDDVYVSSVVKNE